MENILFQIGNNVASAIQGKYEHFLKLSPFILGAIAIFLFGWILAELAARLITGLGHKVKLEVIAEKVGLKHFLQRMKWKKTSSEVIAKGVKGYLIFVFFVEATKIAKLTTVAEFLTTALNYIPDVIVAVFIMLVGIRVGGIVQQLVSTSLEFVKSNTSHILGLAAKYTVVTFAVLAALSELDIAPILVQIMFIGFIAMLTISGGLAFGLGGKDVVKELLEAIKRMEIKELKKK